ncbi:cytochrome c oxidase assembly protein [Galbitalea sp. SE-J8]|uniref:cytochrome c oxidase assembly protein n=1 Tax=Galbitalea sp. SE-J8 TaxID=3054952 RepID=UPI00259CE36D|nr:cytochrome c oxidase assembly protein [Galbitalea sp. SE-J8]MDM4761636.1 cytochrome c oxidase assembly protein [Galbitalea sp. SE-J8]
MPPLVDLVTTWRFSPVALAVLLLAGGLYVAGLVTLHRRGERWSGWRTTGFLLGGLGLFAIVEFGFLGAWSGELRWAFSTRLALDLFAVPGLLTVGKPVTLARRALRGDALRRFERIVGSWAMRLVGNPIVAPLFALAVFSLLLTPIAGVLRLSPVSEALIPVLVPFVGLLLVLPLAGDGEVSAKRIVVIEFMLAFIELLLDALPGILLRLNGTVLDQAGRATGAVPGWFPNPLRDQQLSGDLLWFIAEIVDVPVLAVFIVQWMRNDRREARRFDELSDAEMDALVQQHLRGPAG